MMRPFRPVVALFANIVLIHAMWIGSSFSCAMVAESGSRVGQMTGNDMAGAEMSSMRMNGGRESRAPSSVPADRHAPCRIPWNPDGCQSLAPCLPMAVASPVQMLRSTNAHPGAIRTLVALMPPSVKRAPEPPPPRA